MSHQQGAAGWAAVVGAVLRRPSLWFVALRQAARLVPSGWWRRRPPSPAPDPAYLRFRLLTSSGGDGSGPPEAAEVVAWLRWSRAWPAAVR